MQITFFLLLQATNRPQKVKMARLRIPEPNSGLGAAQQFFGFFAADV